MKTFLSIDIIIICKGLIRNYNDDKSRNEEGKEGRIEGSSPITDAYLIELLMKYPNLLR